MSKICLCLDAKTLEENLRILENNRKYVDLAELRVDKLLPDERFQIRHFPGLAGLPVILTVRRKGDGGFYESGEGARVTLIANALANAKVDRRLNFAYVDIEEDMEIPSLEEAARAFGTRIIRSIHIMDRTDMDIARRVKSVTHTGDEIIKCACSAKSLDDVLIMYNAAKELKGREKVLISMGSAGVCSRILAKKFGSLWSYTCVKETENSEPLMPGMLDPQTLCEMYRFRDIKDDTAVYGILGYPLKVTESPRFFNGVFTREKINAVYVPFPSESVEPFFRIASALNLRGVSVTVPHKQNVLKYLSNESAAVRNIGACNTVVKVRDGWDGFNTDTFGFLDSLLHFIGKKSFRGLKITIVGAGGASRAIAYQIWKHGGKALIVNRSKGKAEELAEKYGFIAGGIYESSQRLIEKYSDILINTTSVGMGPDLNADPIEIYKFQGHEVVMDIIYSPEQTAFLRRAAAAGCATLNGYDMLIRQAKFQYKYFFDTDYPEM